MTGNILSSAYLDNLLDDSTCKSDKRPVIALCKYANNSAFKLQVLSQVGRNLEHDLCFRVKRQSHLKKSITAGLLFNLFVAHVL